MNNELASFFIEFTSKGLSELKTDMLELKNSVEEMSDTFSKSASSGESFFGKLKSWTTSLGGMALGFVSVKRAITDMFNVADKTIDLHLTASRLGVNPLELESLGRISSRFGGSMQDAFTFYESMQDLSFNLGLGRYTQSQADIMSLAKISVQAVQSLDPADRIRYLINQLQSAFSSVADPELRSQMQNAFGNIPNSIRSIMETGNYWELMGKGEGYSFLYTEEARKESIANKNARIALSEAWEKLVNEFTPAVTRLIDEFLTPLVKNFSEFAQDKDLGQILSDWVKEMSNWVKETWPDIKRVFMGIVDVIMAMFNWMFGDGEWQDVMKAGRKMLGINPELSPREDAERQVKNVGMIGGAIAGAALGLGAGGIGAIPGAIIGAFGGNWLGSKAGDTADWINSKLNVPNYIPRINGITNNNYANEMGLTVNLDSKAIARANMTNAGTIVKALNNGMVSATTGGGVKY